MKKILLLSTSITLLTFLFTGCNVVKHSVTYPAYLNAQIWMEQKHECILKNMVYMEDI